jgi:hypothetical protein
VLGQECCVEDPLALLRRDARETKSDPPRGLAIRIARKSTQENLRVFMKH